MKTKTYKIITIFTALMLLLGCEKDFLEVPAEGKLTAADQYSSPDAANGIVVAIYNKLLDWNMHSFSWVGVSSITSDNADKGSDPGDTGTDKPELDNYTFESDAISFSEIWEANYDGIARANKAIVLLPQLTIADATKKQLEGEARFLRAYFNWILLRCFGGVPLVIGTPDPEGSQARATEEEVYNQIIEDLQFGISNLKSKNAQSADEIGRATKGAAKTFLAKVYLYQEKWSEVYTLTQEVIASGEYGLVDDYATIWREVGENSEESIFEVQARVESPISAIAGYSQIQMPRTGDAWGFNSPSEDLVNAYEEGDVRKDATIIFRGDTMWDGSVIESTVPNERYNEKAWVSQTLETWGGSVASTNKNLRIFRYAEVLLIDAEAANELGNISEAKASLNLVRERAGLGDTPASTKDDLRTAIWKERRVELAMESDRKWDLRRQGRVAEVMIAHGKNFIVGKHELFPIPQVQVSLSNGELIQNPGYN